MSIHCAAAERDVLTKKIKKRKSSLVKIKAFPIKVGRPENQATYQYCVTTEQDG